MGDFNKVEFLDDKLGGFDQILGRQDFIDWCLEHGLVDTLFFAPHFTWTNGRTGNHPTFERLDTLELLLNFPYTSIIHHPILFSDHVAIIVSNSVLSFKCRPYNKIDNKCLKAKEVEKIISFI